MKKLRGKTQLFKMLDLEQKQRGLSDKEMARRFGITSIRYNRMMLGAKLINPNILRKFIKEFELNMSLKEFADKWL